MIDIVRLNYELSKLVEYVEEDKDLEPDIAEGILRGLTITINIILDMVRSEDNEIVRLNSLIRSLKGMLDKKNKIALKPLMNKLNELWEIDEILKFYRKDA